MSDFMESAKNFVNSVASRTGWEAQKQMRVRNKQTELEKLLEQRRKLLDELGQTALTLYQQGALTDAQMSRTCAGILELDHDVNKRDTELQEIKNEVYPAEQFAPKPTADYTPPPVSPNSPPPASAPSSFTPPANAAGSASGGATVPCPKCGSLVRPNALYCRGCGAKLR